MTVKALDPTDRKIKLRRSIGYRLPWWRNEYMPAVGRYTMLGLIAGQGVTNWSPCSTVSHFHAPFRLFSDSMENHESNLLIL